MVNINPMRQPAASGSPVAPTGLKSGQGAKEEEFPIANYPYEVDECPNCETRDKTQVIDLMREYDEIIEVWKCFECGAEWELHFTPVKMVIRK